MSLYVKNLSFSYGKRETLKSITADFLPGEITVIAGSNGSGKSTLVKAMITLNNIEKKSVFLKERDILSYSIVDRAKQIGYVAQYMPQDFDFSVYEIVEMGRYPYKKDWDNKKDKVAILDALELTETKELMDRSINTLSGGEMQRVLLARALAGRPKILILDEPSSNLDIKHNIEIMNLIRDLTKRLNITTIMVLHDLNTILHYSDKILLLKSGESLKSGKTKEILTVKNIKETYGIESSIINNEYGTKYIATN